MTLRFIWKFVFQTLVIWSLVSWSFSPSLFSSYSSIYITLINGNIPKISFRGVSSLCVSICLVPSTSWYADCQWAIFSVAISIMLQLQIKRKGQRERWSFKMFPSERLLLFFSYVSETYIILPSSSPNLRPLAWHPWSPTHK
jgi:hypothetical protein